MLEAAFWGFVGGAALLVGAVIALVWRVPSRLVGIVMAFGSGVLISAVPSNWCRRRSRPRAGSPSSSGLLRVRSPSSSAT